MSIGTGFLLTPTVSKYSTSWFLGSQPINKQLQKSCTGLRPTVLRKPAYQQTTTKIMYRAQAQGCWEASLSTNNYKNHVQGSGPRFLGSQPINKQLQKSCTGLRPTVVGKPAYQQQLQKSCTGLRPTVVRKPAYQQTTTKIMYRAQAHGCWEASLSTTTTKIMYRAQAHGS